MHSFSYWFVAGLRLAGDEWICVTPMAAHRFVFAKDSAGMWTPPKGLCANALGCCCIHFVCCITLWSIVSPSGHLHRLLSYQSCLLHHPPVYRITLRAFYYTA